MVFQKKSLHGPAAFGNTLQLVGDEPLQLELSTEGSAITSASQGGSGRLRTGQQESKIDTLRDRGRGGIDQGRQGNLRDLREERRDLIRRDGIVIEDVQWGCQKGSKASKLNKPSNPLRYFYEPPSSVPMFGDDAPFRPRFGAGLGGYWTPFNLLTLVDVRITPFVSVPLLDILAIDPTKNVGDAYGGGLIYAFSYVVSTGNSPLKAAGPWATLLPITVESLPRVAASVIRQWGNATGSTVALRVQDLNATARARSTGAMGTNIDTLQDLIEFQEGVYAVWQMRDEIISSLLTKFSNQIGGVESLTPVDPTNRTSADLMQLNLWMRGRHGSPGSLDSASLQLIQGSIRSTWGVMFAGQPQAGERIQSCAFSQTTDRSGGRTPFKAGDLFAASVLKGVASQFVRQDDAVPGMPTGSYGQMWEAAGGVVDLTPSLTFRPKTPSDNQTKAWGLYLNLRMVFANQKVKGAIGTGNLLATVFEHGLSEKSKIAVTQFLTSQHLTTSPIATTQIRVKGMTRQSPSTDLESFLNALLVLDIGCLNGTQNLLRSAIGQFSMWIPQRTSAIQSGEAQVFDPVKALVRAFAPPPMFNYVNVLPTFHVALQNDDGPYAVWSDETPFVPIVIDGDGDVITIPGRDENGEEPGTDVIEDPIDPEPFPREVIEEIIKTPLFTMIADHIGVDLNEQIGVIVAHAHLWGIPAQGVMAYLILASHYNTTPIGEVNTLFSAGFQSTLSADISLQEAFMRIGGALEQHQDGTLSDAQLLSFFNQRGSIQIGKQEGEGLSTTTKVLIGVGGVGALYFLYQKFIKPNDA